MIVEELVSSNVMMEKLASQLPRDVTPELTALIGKMKPAARSREVCTGFVLASHTLSVIR